MAPRIPLWKLFYSLPKHDPNSAFSAQDKKHLKAFCEPCVESTIEKLLTSERIDIAEGRRSEPESNHDKLCDEVVALRIKNSEYLCGGKADQMLDHIENCPVIGTRPELIARRDTVKQEYAAFREKKADKATRSWS
ncbi:hypothetical protein V5O48_018036, partial [Marasmius crinis-equi]